MRTRLAGTTAALFLIAGLGAAFAAEDDAMTGRINHGSAEAAKPSPPTGGMPNALDDSARNMPATAKSSAINSGAATAGPQNPAIGAAPAGAPPGSSPQTTPSTISVQNAAEDRLSIEQRRLQLTDEEKQALRNSILTDKQTGSEMADSRVAEAKIGHVLPSSVAMVALPAQAISQVPDVKDFKYVRAGERLLIVDPENWMVVGVLQ